VGLRRAQRYDRRFRRVEHVQNGLRRFLIGGLAQRQRQRNRKQDESPHARPPIRE
jgi:hypothetical protein